MTASDRFGTRIVRRSDPVLLILRPVLGIAAAAFTIAGSQSAVRAVLVGVFVLVVPGWSLLEIWELTHGWLGFALVVATSTALASAVATVMLYLGTWSPTITLLRTGRDHCRDRPVQGGPAGGALRAVRVEGGDGVMVALLSGPVGYIPVLGALTFLVSRAFARERRGERAAPERRLLRVAVVVAIALAAALLLLRLLDLTT